MPLEIQTNDCVRDVGFRGVQTSASEEWCPRGSQMRSRIARQSSRICPHVVWCSVVSFQSFRALARVRVEVEQVRKSFQVSGVVGLGTFQGLLFGMEVSRRYGSAVRYLNNYGIAVTVSVHFNRLARSYGL